jgi:predicted ATPase
VSASPDVRPVRRVQRDPSADYDESAWPYRLPPIRQVLSDGLELPAGVTFLVGENGSGKSTLVEGIAQAYGLNAEGGSRGAQHRTRVSESPLGSALQLVKSPDPGLWSYFLRAETMHGFYTYVEETFRESGRLLPAEERLHELSHGESFLQVLRSKFNAPGFYLMDEPESAMSFQSSLGLLALLDELRRGGSQVLIATHSPLLAALPGACILEVGAHGLRESSWEELDLVRDWKGFLEAPQRWLRHLLGDEP